MLLLQFLCLSLLAIIGQSDGTVIPSSASNPSDTKLAVAETTKRQARTYGSFGGGSGGGGGYNYNRPYEPRPYEPQQFERPYERQHTRCISCLYAGMQGGGSAAAPPYLDRDR